MANVAAVTLTVTGDAATVAEFYEKTVREHRERCGGENSHAEECLIFNTAEYLPAEGDHKLEDGVASFDFDARWCAPWDYINQLSEENPSLLFHTYQVEVMLGVLNGTYMMAGSELLVEERAELEAFGHDWVLDAGSLTCCGWDQEEMEERLEEGKEPEPDWTVFGNEEIEDWDTCFWEMRWVLAEALQFDAQVADALLTQRKVAV